MVGSIRNFIYAYDDRAPAVEKLASDQTKIVSLTITESGYRMLEETEDLDFSHPEIKHDLEYPNEPMGVYGLLALSLRKRKEKGLMPYTIMSCDNVCHNGDMARKGMLQFVRQQDEVLARWIE